MHGGVYVRDVGSVANHQIGQIDEPISEWHAVTCIVVSYAGNLW
jgi:hypothetical protein